MPRKDAPSGENPENHEEASQDTPACENLSEPAKEPDGDVDQTPEQGQNAIAEPDADSVPEPRTSFLLQFYVLNQIYRWLYFLGIQLIRSSRRRLHRFLYKWNQVTAEARKDLGQVWKNLRIGIHFGWRELTSPIRDMRTKVRELREEVRHETKYGSNISLLHARCRLLWYLLRRLGAILHWLFNYIAPVAACVVVYLTVQTYLDQTYVLRLEYNGEEIGYISDESVFTQAQSAMKGRLTDIEGALVPTILPHYEVIVREDQKLLTVDHLTDILLRSSGNELLEGYGLYLETSEGSDRMQLLGVVEDGTEILQFLDAMREKFRTSDLPRNAKVQFLKKIQLKPGLYPVKQLRPVGELKAELSGEQRGETYYTVVEGDTPLRIAAKNGVTMDDLERLNPDMESGLYPGDQLLVSRSVPKLGVKITTTQKYREEIPFVIQQETVSTQNIGWTNLKQEGKEGIREITAEIVLIDGVETERNIVDRRVIREPVDQILQVGGSRPLQVVPQDSTGTLPSGTFMWPTNGGSIGTGFRGYYGHTGSDILYSGCYGAPVYASAAGTVTLVRYDVYNYGYHVIIEHGGGLQTLYAHCSQLFVNVGDQVQQGQQIAAIGRTGNTTGPHLHFEVRKNGTPVDAAPYLYN